ncbi:MAG: NAD(P)-dependent oxidoreductase [Prolixibacteraceae bacterium]|nr:NAD(P)-dependent oxidoreductase [Prolixibacteraceae bacterium]
MKIFVIGGTGLVGSYLLPELIKRGDEVYALTRSGSKTEKLNNTGVVPVVGDIRKPESFVSVLPEKLDMIVLLAMPQVVPGKRMTKKKKEELTEDTNAFFRNSMNLAIEYDIPIILPGGTSFKTTGDQIADETWPVLREGLVEIGADTDVMVSEAFKTGKPKASQLMYGKIYGNGGMFLFQYNMIEKGRGGIIGKGDNCIPNIYAGDIASAIIKIIEKQPWGERFLICDDTPVAQADFVTYMADIMGKKKPGHVPLFILKLVIGNEFLSIIQMNCKVSNEKAKRILGWKPVFPSYREGLKAVVEEIKASKK